MTSARPSRIFMDLGTAGPSCLMIISCVIILFIGTLERLAFMIYIAPTVVIHVRISSFLHPPYIIKAEFEFQDSLLQGGVREEVCREIGCMEWGPVDVCKMTVDVSSVPVRVGYFVD